MDTVWNYQIKGHKNLPKILFFKFIQMCHTSKLWHIFFKYFFSFFGKIVQHFLYQNYLPTQNSSGWHTAKAFSSQIHFSFVANRYLQLKILLECPKSKSSDVFLNIGCFYIFKMCHISKCWTSGITKFLHSFISFKCFFV